jgi:hypothetical protein
MCRNIKMLHNFEPPATNEEVHLSSLQFVRNFAIIAAIKTSLQKQQTSWRSR